MMISLHMYDELTKQTNKMLRQKTAMSIRPRTTLITVNIRYIQIYNNIAATKTVAVWPLLPLYRIIATHYPDHNVENTLLSFGDTIIKDWNLPIVICQRYGNLMKVCTNLVPMVINLIGDRDIQMVCKKCEIKFFLYN